MTMGKFKDFEQRKKEGVTAVSRDMQSMARQMLMFSVCMITPTGKNEVEAVKDRMSAEKDRFSSAIDLADRMYDVAAERCGHNSDKVPAVAQLITFLSAVKRCREIMMEDEVYANMITEAGL